MRTRSSITHEHVDRVDALRLAGLQAPVYGPADSTIAGLDVIAISAEPEFTAAGFGSGLWEESTPRCWWVAPAAPTWGYVVEDTLYHPLGTRCTCRR